MILCHDTGDLEQTMLKKFCMGQKLRFLFKPHELPSVLDPLISDYEARFCADIRGTLFNDTLAFDASFNQQQEEESWSKRDETLLPSRIYDGLKVWIRKHDPSTNYNISSRAFQRTHIACLGEVF